MQVYVQVPAFSESPWMDQLDAVANQAAPDDFNVHREAWVTPNAPQKRMCLTWVQARDHPKFEAHEAPPGKLATRNAAHNHAVEEGADVIVTWDADAPPRRPDTLTRLLEPFRDPTVSAVNGRPVAPATPVGIPWHVASRVEDKVRPHLHGQLSAFRADVWDQVGPFDTNIDQTDIAQVRQVEEFEFYDKVGEHGRIVEAEGAVVTNDTRRAECKVARAFDRFGHYGAETYCSSRSSVTFQPRDDSGCGCGD